MSSLHESKVYRSGPRHRQQRFAGRNPATSLAGLRRSAVPVTAQSTLTQIDFCTPVPSSVACLEDSEDDEYKPSGKPSSKRKRKARLPGKGGPKQTTLTQIYSSFEDIESDEEPLQSIEDTVQETQSQQDRKVQGGDPDAGSIISRSPQTTDLPTRADLDASLRPSTSPSGRKLCEALAYSPATPNRRRWQEIPSSETPQSLILEPETPRNDNLRSSLERSPLHSRSKDTSVSQLQGAPKSGQSTHVEAEAEAADQARGSSPVFRKPLLPWLGRSSNRTANKFDGPSTLPKQHRDFVQDSQIDDLGESLDADDTVQSTYVPATSFSTHGATQDRSSFADLSMPESMADPVWSALSRDAARYGQTQRQNAPDVTATVAAAESLASTQVADENLEVVQELKVEAKDHAYGVSSLRRKSTELIDLTSDLPSQRATTPTSTAGTPPRRSNVVQQESETRGSHRHNVPPRPSQATTQSGPPSPSRIPQSPMQPSSCPRASPELTSSPPTGGRTATMKTPRSSFSLYAPDDAPEVSCTNKRKRDDSSGAKEGLNADPLPYPSRRRFERAQDVLPDSLLDFSVPALPVWSSPAPLPEVDEGCEDGDDDDNDDDDDVGVDLEEDAQKADKRSLAGDQVERRHDLLWTLWSSPSRHSDQDYSLDPPGGGWRSSARTKR